MTSSEPLKEGVPYDEKQAGDPFGPRKARHCRDRCGRARAEVTRT